MVEEAVAVVAEDLIDLLDDPRPPPEVPPELEVRELEALEVVDLRQVSGTQKPSEAIGSHRKPSEAIGSHAIGRSSDAIKGHRKAIGRP